MRKPVVLILTNALILVAIFVLLAQSLVVAQRVARTGKVQGRVEYQLAGQTGFQPISDGQALKRGDTIRTGANGSLEFRWIDGTRCKLMPNSMLKVRTASYNSMKGAEDSRLQLTQGKLFVRITKKLSQGSNFKVETPSAVTSVKGTIFSVKAQAGRTDVDVYRGRVAVSPAGADGKQVVNVDQGKRFSLEPYGNVRAISKTDNAIFEAQPSIARPELRAWVEDLKTGTGKARLHVQTENGNVIKVDGQIVKPEGVGVIVQDVTLIKGRNSWKVESIDRHGIVSQMVQTFDYQTPVTTTQHS